MLANCFFLSYWILQHSYHSFFLREWNSIAVSKLSVFPQHIKIERIVSTQKPVPYFKRPFLNFKSVKKRCIVDANRAWPPVALFRCQTFQPTPVGRTWEANLDLIFLCNVPLIFSLSTCASLTEEYSDVSVDKDCVSVGKQLIGQVLFLICHGCLPHSTLSITLIHFCVWVDLI